MLWIRCWRWFINYKPKITDKTHEAGHAVVRDPFDPNGGIWERIGTLYNWIRKMVKK